MVYGLASRAPPLGNTHCHREDHPVNLVGSLVAMSPVRCPYADHTADMLCQFNDCTGGTLLSYTIACHDAVTRK